VTDEQQVAAYLKQVAEEDRKERLGVYERMRDEIMAKQSIGEPCTLFVRQSSMAPENFLRAGVSEIHLRPCAPGPPHPALAASLRSGSLRLL
jgi:hypothetical protein